MWLSKLEQLLASTFNEDELIMLVGSISGGDDVLYDMSSKASLRELSHHIAQEVHRRQLTSQLFERLMELRPHRYAAIMSVRDLWMISSHHSGLVLVTHQRPQIARLSIALFVSVMLFVGASIWALSLRQELAATKSDLDALSEYISNH